MAVKIDAGECVACGACIDECPNEALSMADVAVVDEGACIECGICIDACPAGAISE